jgi:hypothetical protein
MKEVGLGRNKGRKFAMDYLKDIIWYLRRAGFTMHQEETIREFLKRVKYNHDELFSNSPDITQILEKIRYSDQEVSGEESLVLDKFRKRVKKLAVKKAGVLQLLISLYILGK